MAEPQPSPAITVPGLPARPTLRPGLRVVRRDVASLQIGVDPPHRMILPDQPCVRRMLAELEAGRQPVVSEPDAVRWLVRLVDAGLVVDVEPGGSAVAQFGGDARRRVAARAHARIGVMGSVTLGRAARTALGMAGLVPTEPGPDSDVVLVAAGGEPVRGLLDNLVRDGVPHLVLTASAASIRLGPFVAPGRTACLRCVDAHLAEPDPRRPLVIEQVARAIEENNDEPHDPLLLALALAWAARDLTRYVEGDEPSTWSSTVDIGAREAPHCQVWSRHPHCGCSWDEFLSELPC
ncbi:MAG: hypothetical protein WKF79_01190 [Nocardioides sp.]